MARPDPPVVQLSARVSYAVSVYLQALEGGADARSAYAAAVEVAGLNSAERGALRSALHAR